MATTRKGIAAAVGKIVAVSEKIKARAEAVVEMAGDEDFADKKIVSAMEKISTAKTQFDNAFSNFAEKASDFGGEGAAEEKAAPKRGRKPKAEAEEEKPVAKKRGRKPKTETEEEKPVAKKRGRKPKAEAEEKPAKSEKRGRKPKKETSEKPAKVVKKKKAEVEEDDLFGDDIFDEAPAKKKSKKNKKNRG